MTNIQLTQELVKTYFDYKDGFLYWKIRTATNQIKIGDRAGSLKKSDNRYRIVLRGKSCLAHRLIFLWHNGWMPKSLDHIDRNGINNKIENLREATYSQNSKNRCSFKNSSSKYLGVYFRKDNKKWGAKIQVDGKQIHLGFYEIETAAAIAYNAAAVRYHGEFANPNIIAA